MKTLNNHFSSSRSGRNLLCVSLLLVTALRSSALPETWTGGTSADWNTGTNWNSVAGSVPTNADTAIFNGTSNNTAVTFSAASTANSITFDTSAAAYTLGTTASTNTLVLTSTGTISTTSAVTNVETINQQLSLGGAYTFSSSAATADTLNFGGKINLNANTLSLAGTNLGANTLSGVISGTGGITTNVTGNTSNWVLTGANTYSGATQVSKGSVQIGNGSTGSINSSSAVSVASAGTLLFDEVNGSTISNAIADSGIVVGAEGAGITNTLSGGITGSGGQFKQNGAGTTVLSGAGNYTGGTTVSNGSLIFDYSGASVNQISGSSSFLTVGSNGNFTMTGRTGATISQVFSKATFGFGNAATGSLGGQENVAFNAVGTGTLNVTLNNISGSLGSTVNFTLPTSGTITANAGGGTTGSYAGVGAADGILMASGNQGGVVYPYATVNNNDWAALTGGTAGGSVGTNTQTLTGATLVAGSSISGFYALTTSGTQALVANSNYDVGSGITATTVGTAATITSLRFNQAQATTITDSAALTVGGILITSAVGNNLTTIGGSGGLKGPGFGALNIIQNNTSNGFTISAPLLDNNAYALVKSGPGLLTLTSTASTYKGKTFLNGGITNIAGDGSLGFAPTSYGAGNITFSGGTLQLASSFNLTANRGITVDTGGAFFDTNGNNSTYGGIITGSVGAAFNKIDATGAGTLTLTGASTFNGAMNVKSGTLSINNIANAGQQISITTQVSSTAATLNTTTGLVNGTTYSITGFPNQITEGTTFTYTGSPSITLSAAASNTASTALINVGVANALGLSTNASTNLTLGSTVGATLQYTGAAASTDRLFQLNNTANSLTDHLDASGSGALSFTNTGTITYGTLGMTETLDLTGSNTGGNTLAPILTDDGSGAVSLTKTGAGSWAVTGANTYSGGTTISNGTFYANTTGTGNSSTGAGTVSVSGSGILSGSGNIAPTGAHGVSVGSGGTLAPGVNSVAGSGVAAPGQSVVPFLGTPGAVANANLTLDTTNFSGGSVGTGTIPGGSTFVGTLGTNTALLTLNSANLTFALGAGTSSSAIVVGGLNANTIVFNGTSTVTINDLIGASLTQNGEYTLFQGNNSTIYSGLTVSSTLTPGLGYQITGGLQFLTQTSGNFYSQWYTTSQFYVNGDNIDVEVVPEPSTWALMLGGLAALIFIQRRKRSLK